MDTVEQIKGKLSIVDVISPYVKLAKAGKYWRGLSPFNKEKSPSFYVNVERNSYYCFSSGQGGDMFTFIEKMEGVDFKGAMKILAEKAGVEIVYSGGGAPKEDKGKKDKLYEMVAQAETFFAEQLLLGKGVTGSAYEYALSRGLTPDTISAWNLGYAPDGWRTLLEKLAEYGYSNTELVAAGLIKEADEKKGTWYDRFRNRLMFPIRDSAGRTVAFTGRALDPNDQAKYLNSPETDLFKKSEVLFGMDKAKDAVRTRGFALLVEGQMDLLLLHQIGFQNTVALSGTALTPQHLSLIKRYADNLMLALDSDRAGLAASMKNAIAALHASMRVKAVRLPRGKDPADVAKEDPKDMTKRIADSEPIVEFFLSVLNENETDAHHLIIAAEKTVLPLIQAIESPMEREHFVGVAARSLSSTPEAIRSALDRLPKGDRPEVGGPLQAMATPVKQAKTDEKGSMRRARRLHAIAFAFAGTGLAKRLESEHTRIIGAPFPETPPPEQSIFEEGIAFGEAPEESDADELIRALEREVLNERYAEATARLRRAEASHDPEAISRAVEESRTLAKQISSFS